jgi:ABC-type Fe3+/spermidine/putrescine transport system ATPase subunit
MSDGPVDIASGANMVHGRIVDVSYGGAFTRYAVRNDDLEVVVMEQNQGAGPRARTGDEVWLTWLVEQTLVLPGTRDEAEQGQQAAADARNYQPSSGG